MWIGSLVTSNFVGRVYSIAKFREATPFFFFWTTVFGKILAVEQVYSVAI